MSLNYDYSKVPADRKERDQWGEAMVWSCYLLDLGEVSEELLDEWEFRLKLATECGVFVINRYTGKGIKKSNVAMDVVRKFVGLVTNVHTTKRKVFEKKMLAVLK